uniref:hypothetical protein n=1 Tax=Nonomuraea sp. CA-251285 TaxID=3240002 RepID=UPI003F498F50
MKIETSMGDFDPANYAEGFRFPDGTGDGAVTVWPIKKSDKWRIIHGGLTLAADGTWLQTQFLSPDALADAELLGHEKTRALALAYERAQTRPTETDHHLAAERAKAETKRRQAAPAESR